MAYFAYPSKPHIAVDNRRNNGGTYGPGALLTALHDTLYDRIRAQSWDLHPYWEANRMVAHTSAAGGADENVYTLVYLRSEEQARMVEENMGFESRSRDYGGLNPNRHPVIELRHTRDHFAIEFIISPASWWDQQNVIGKLELDRHRAGLRTLLRSIRPDYCFGFWNGTHLSDMHLTSWQLVQSGILSEWIDTFADGQDYLRFGVWYEHDDPALAPQRISAEVYERLTDLYALYDFFVWTSNNNYRSFYEKRYHGQRRYA